MMQAAAATEGAWGRRGGAACAASRWTRSATSGGGGRSARRAPTKQRERGVRAYVTDVKGQHVRSYIAVEEVCKKQSYKERTSWFLKSLG